MPTDHACHAAAERAAHGLTPVRSVLVPADPSEHAAAEVMPVVLRNHLGANAGPPRAAARRPVRVGVATGAAVLLMCLDGLRAEVSGEMAAWHADLGRRLHEALAEPRAPGRATDVWQSLAALQRRAHETLITVADGDRRGPAGPRLLVARLALLEDAVTGALRRSAVPAATADGCAHELAAATGSLFGLDPSRDRGADG
ncbi:hypothetical protein ACFYOV_31095 [Streptomyces sp. NPDC005931]|uniref:hypothetical protein n=1 Tax=Streptomyces sp. NPDC005931 TaxID=3364737 RepID=UPI0036CEF400